MKKVYRNVAVQLQNVTAAVHVGDAKPGHHHQSGAVEGNHPPVVLQRDFVEWISLINNSFLDDRTKKEYIELIDSRIGKLI